MIKYPEFGEKISTSSKVTAKLYPKNVKAHRDLIKSTKARCACCGVPSDPIKGVESGFLEYIDAETPYLLCVLCRQASNLNRVYNGVKEHGVIIYAPSMDQSAIIGITHLYFALGKTDSEYASKISDLYFSIKKLSEDLSFVTPYSKKMDGSIEAYREIVDALPMHISKNQWHLIKHLRYVPSIPAFQYESTYWSMQLKKRFNDKWLDKQCERLESR